MLDQINFPTTISLYNIPFNIVTEKYQDHMYDRICVILKVRDTDIRFRFFISPEVLNDQNISSLHTQLHYYFCKFKEEVRKILFNPSEYNYCTPELILEKYFESYIYSKNIRYPRNLQEILKNPNIICGRRKGHKTSLVALLENDLYLDIFKKTCIVFSTFGERDLFLDRLSPRAYLNYRNNCIAHTNEARGRYFSFFIFNNLSNIHPQIISYFQNYSTNNFHYIILGN